MNLKKQAVILQMLLSTVLFSCSKGGGGTPPVANFTITGVRDVDMSTISSNTFTFPITIQAAAGKTDTVTLYANETPSGVSVHFTPLVGVTPFTSTVTVTAFNQGAGTYQFKINGVGLSGVRTYTVNLTLPAYRGWQLGSDIFHREGVTSYPGDATSPARISVNAAGGAFLIMTFAPGAGLPTSNRVYTISDTALLSDRMTLKVLDGVHKWKSTGGGTTAGTFTFEGGKFSFRCTNVDMVEGTEHKQLTCTFSE
jgi:hypothetical protein